MVNTKISNFSFFPKIIINLFVLQTINSDISFFNLLEKI
jgi:hypothetical protein